MLKSIVRAKRTIVRQVMPPIIVSAIDHVTGRAKSKVRERRGGIEIGGCLLRVHPDSYWTLAHFYGTHTQATEEMREFLQLSRGRKRLLDLGALHGVFALTFAVGGGSALAVEASPIAFARLLYNVHANPDLAITPLECAVSDQTGGDLGMQLRDEMAAVTPDGPTITVPRMTGDDICRRNNFMPDVIKIDVEGHEAHVLAGLHDVIESTRPILFLETHPGRYHAERLNGELRWLSSLGYRSLGSQHAIDAIAGVTGIPALRSVLAAGDVPG